MTTEDWKNKTNHLAISVIGGKILNSTKNDITNYKPMLHLILIMHVSHHNSSILTCMTIRDIAIRATTIVDGRMQY